MEEKREAVQLFNAELDDSLLDVKLDGQARRQTAEAMQRSRRHALTGDPWKVGGACAGTVRSASLSRTRGGTTSGLFSDFQPLEGSESAAALHERRTSKERPSGRPRREDAESVQKSRAHRQPWRSGGACAGRVRAASLSRTRGSTVSGLFSDVQPLAGSESMALLEEQKRLKQERRERHRCNMSSTDSCSGVPRSPSVPSLILPQRIVQHPDSGNIKDNEERAEEAAEFGLSDDVEWDRIPKTLPAGSGFSSVRCARKFASGGA